MIFCNLKSKIILITITIYLVVGFATLIAFQATSRAIIHTFALRFASKEALLEKNKISAIIDREVVLAQKMADDLTLRRWAANEKDPELRTMALTELESYRKLFRDQSFFIALAPTGNYYAYNRTPGEEGIKVHPLQAGSADDRWFFEGLQHLQTYALNLDYNPSLHETKVWINALLSDSSGKPLGICGGGINITSFLHDIVTMNEAGLSTIIIDRSGVIQAHADRAIVDHNATTRDPAQKTTIFQLMNGAPAENLLQGAIAALATGKERVAAFPVHFGGREYLLALSSLKEVGWFNLVLVDISSVISMRAFLPILISMALALLLMIVSLALFMNRLVLAPLSKLTAAASEVASGHYDIAIPNASDDEIGRLTSAFNTMNATILDHTGNLENKVKQRTNELSAANRLLEESQEKIEASIAYARMIQTAILPDHETLQRFLGDHLLIYRPKEMVGGDFYYLHKDNDRTLLAVIDCTGHGIPGAFMTMTVNAILNHVVEEKRGATPAEILAALDTRLLRTLKLQEVDAGLDIALCAFTAGSNALIFAGAGLSLYLLGPEGLREIKGDHARVGYRNLRRKSSYRDHQLLLTPGDSCYLTTDGLLDERGGRQGFGFGTHRFKEMLLAQNGRPFPEQGAACDAILANYRGSYRQRDDVTLIGFRLPESFFPLNPLTPEPMEAAHGSLLAPRRILK